MPKMLMLSIAASGALAGAAIIHAFYRREALADIANAAIRQSRRAVSCISAVLSRARHREALRFERSNSSFDAYRADVIGTLAAEQKEFEAFLDRLHRMKDEREFQAYLASRRAAKADPAVVDAAVNKGD